MSEEPTIISQASDLSPGDFYEDCAYHPCLCVRVADEGDEVNGISLVDGSTPRSCSIFHCGLRKLTFVQAMRWKFYGPADVEVPVKSRWWENSSPVFEWPVPDGFPKTAD